MLQQRSLCRMPPRRQPAYSMRRHQRPLTGPIAPRARTHLSLAPFSRGKVVQAPAPDLPADQPQAGQPNRSAHPAHLTVTTFGQRHFDPAVWYRFAHADRRVAVPQIRWRDQAYLSRARRPVLQRQPGSKRVKIALCRVALDLRQICLLYTSPSPRDLSTSRMPSSA